MPAKQAASSAARWPPAGRSVGGRARLVRSITVLARRGLQAGRGTRPEPWPGEEGWGATRGVAIGQSPRPEDPVALSGSPQLKTSPGRALFHRAARTFGPPPPAQRPPRPAVDRSRSMNFRCRATYERRPKPPPGPPRASVRIDPLDGTARHRCRLIAPRTRSAKNDYFRTSPCDRPVRVGVSVKCAVALSPKAMVLLTASRDTSRVPQVRS
jgi:hypothetical protein